MSLHRRAVLAGAAAGGLAPAAFAAGQPGAHRALADLREKLSIPALGGAAARVRKIVWAEALGQADAEQGIAATPAHLFRLGSCSKVVTAVIAARLADRGVVDLDAPIGRYRPSLPKAHQATTLRQLLGQQGGVRHYDGRDIGAVGPDGPIDLRSYRTTEDMLAIFIDDPLVAAPGESYVYSTFGFTLISAVLESASGKSFPDLVAALSRVIGAGFAVERPTEPLGQPVAGQVRPYQPAPGRTPPFTPSAPQNPSYKWAGGGLMGSASDLAKLGGALLKPGLLPAPLLQTMFTPQIPAKGHGQYVVGLTWRLDTDAAGRRRFHHAGSIDGGRAGVVIYPDQGLALGLTSNLSQAPGDPLPALSALADTFVQGPQTRG